MSVDAATAAPDATESGRRTRNGDRDPYRFLSTRLVRELIAADARAESMDEDRVRAGRRLLAVIAEGLSHTGAALLDPEDLGEMVSQGLQPGELQLLAAPSPSSGGPLLRRALREQRAFLVGPGSPEPLLSSLRRIRSHWTALVVVPLSIRRRCVALLVLASTDQAASAACLRSLAPAFRLLALLLRPAPRAELAAGESLEPAGESLEPAGEIERCLVTIEELRVRLAESEEQRRDFADRESALGATQRAEMESLRARVAELEADGAAQRSALGRCEELESEGKRLAAHVDDRDQRIAELEQANHVLAQRVEDFDLERVAPLPKAAEAVGLASSAQAGVDPSGEEDLVEAAEAEEIAPIAVLDDDASGLGEIAAAAVAALTGDESGIEVPSPEPSPDGFAAIPVAQTSPSVLDFESAAPSDCEVSVWHLGQDQASRTWVTELAARSRIEVWTGEGTPPRAERTLLSLNLFDDSVMQAADLISRGHDIDGVVYGFDSQEGRGFEVGEVGWIARPLEPETALARVRRRAGDRRGGLVIASAQLREIAAFRKALAQAEIAGSVACDLRQATDLLDIVGTPDVVLIDLALDGGQGLALARHLRRDDQTSSVPIVFLLPGKVQPTAFRRDAERAGILEPYGDEDARRLLNGVLATLR